MQGIKKRSLALTTAFMLVLSMFSFLPHGWLDQASAEDAVYDLYICGVQVNGGNASDILGGGEASYDPEANILSLKKNIGLPEEQGGVIVDCRIKGLTVRAENDITISRPGIGAAVCVYEDTTVTGRMTLTGGAGIMVVGCDLTVDHADLDIAGNGWGIYGGLLEDPPTKLTVNASSIRASGEEGAICGFTGGIYLNGCGILTADCSVRDGSFSDAYTEQPTPLAEAEVTTADIYELEVAGRRVSSINKGDILGNGEASYDPETNALTLKKDITCNKDNTDGSTPCITNRIGGLTIKADNEVTLTREQFGAGIYTEKDITLTGKMTIEGGVGLLASDCQIIISDADLTVIGHNGSAAQGGMLGGTNTSRMTINNSEVRFNGTEDGSVVNFGNGLELNGCNLLNQGVFFDGVSYLYLGTTEPATNVEITTSEVYDLVVGNQRVYSKNASDILGNGEASYDPETNTLTLKKDFTLTDDRAIPVVRNNISGLTLNAESGITLTREGFGAAIITEEDMTLTGRMTITGGVGILVGDAQLTVKDADLDISSGGGAIIGRLGEEFGKTSRLVIDNSKISAKNDEAGAVYGFPNGIELDNCGILTGDCEIKDGCILESYVDDPLPVSEVEITNAEIYGLEIAGQKVTSDNMDDILGNGEASYDPETNTLTLKKDITCNKDNTEGATPCISNRIDGLTVKAEGEVTLTREEFGACIYSEADMTLTGKMNVSGGAGILVTDSTLTITDAEINAVGNSSSGITGGRFGNESKLVINNSTVIAVSHDEEEGSGAITGFGKGIELIDSALAPGCVINDGSVCGSDGVTPAGSAEADPVVKFDLYVYGTQVTSGNMTDILGDGVFSYDDTAKTLTVSGNHSMNLKDIAIKNSIEGLTVNIAADSKLSGCFETSKSMTLTGPGKLTLETFSTYQAVLIWGMGNTFTIKDADVSVTGGYMIGSSMNGQNTLSIENSTLYTRISCSFTTPSRDLAAIVLTGCDLKLPEGGSVSGAVIYDGDEQLAKEVRIAPPLEIRKGDINSDGHVDVTDLTILARSLAKWTGYAAQVNDLNADVDGDGEVTVTDYSILARALARWPGYAEEHNIVLG